MIIPEKGNGSMEPMDGAIIMKFNSIIVETHVALHFWLTSLTAPALQVDRAGSNTLPGEANG